MRDLFVLILCFIFTVIYIVGTVRFTKNKDSWREIILNEFFIFGVLGLFGLLGYIVFFIL